VTPGIYPSPRGGTAGATTRRRAGTLVAALFGAVLGLSCAAAGATVITNATLSGNEDERLLFSLPGSELGDVSIDAISFGPNAAGSGFVDALGNPFGVGAMLASGGAPIDIGFDPATDMFGNNFITLDYSVAGQADSYRQVIDIRNVDDVPRATLVEHVEVVKGEFYDFAIGGYDPENQDFNVLITLLPTDFGFCPGAFYQTSHPATSLEVPRFTNTLDGTNHNETNGWQSRIRWDPGSVAQLPVFNDPSLLPSGRTGIHCFFTYSFVQNKQVVGDLHEFSITLLDAPTTPVPAPPALPLLASGLAVMFVATRLRRQNRAA
jgi:hypothetical protein